MTTDYSGMLKEFHKKFNHHIEEHPTSVVPDNVFELRVKLMREELNETIAAMVDENLVEIADGLADLLYVVFGTAISYGIPIDEIFTEVHRSNMTKSMLKDEKSIKGKTLKGENWEPPRIHDILKHHITQGEFQNDLNRRR